MTDPQADVPRLSWSILVQHRHPVRYQDIQTTPITVSWRAPASHDVQRTFKVRTPRSGVWHLVHFKGQHYSPFKASTRTAVSSLSRTTMHTVPDEPLPNHSQGNVLRLPGLEPLYAGYTLEHIQEEILRVTQNTLVVDGILHFPCDGLFWCLVTKDGDFTLDAALSHQPDRLPVAAFPEGLACRQFETVNGSVKPNPNLTITCVKDAY